MPAELERKLKATAHERGYGKERTDRYVYGTLANYRKHRAKKSAHFTQDRPGHFVRS